MTLALIEQQTRTYAQQRTDLGRQVQRLDDALQRTRRLYIDDIKLQVQRVKQAEAQLTETIDSNRALFTKPRTQILFGIRVGIQKGKGQINIEDKDQMIRLIRKHFPAQCDLLIKVSETPIKKALGNLTVAELKKIGAVVEETDDRITIKAVDSQIEKLVDALLVESEEIG